MLQAWGLAHLNNLTAWLGYKTMTHETVRLWGTIAQGVCLKAAGGKQGPWQAHIVVVSSKGSVAR